MNSDESYKLLYIEDNPASLKLLEHIVKRHTSFEFFSASDGQAGVEMARNELPDLIVMDIDLPVMNGYKAFELLRSTPCTARIPVIALTADARKQDIEKGLKAGFEHYLTKPVDVHHFIQTVTKFLDTRHQ
ncbi:MAG: response regulator [Gammaproteobacteria bacterium]|nr:MAG: response regulator [Gammaproteobacteria bacterium]